MTINHALLLEVIQENPELSIHRKHGDAGVDAFRKTGWTVSKIFECVHPTKVANEMLVIRCVEDESDPFPDEASLVFGTVDAAINDLTNCRLVQSLESGGVRVWLDSFAINENELNDSFVLYRYCKSVDSFFADGKWSSFKKVGDYHSIYHVPTFSDLNSAIEYYRAQYARYSSCLILTECWDNGKRILFSPKPEHVMRNSLRQFLDITLRDAEVRAEQNVDDSHPVDIKVTFSSSSFLALIEIKWLGKSKTASSGNTLTTYSAVRARDGAKQLADYLDANNQQAPTNQTKGYLVVFDGRRRNTNENSTSINSSDGMHFANAEIEFDPKFHEERTDFAEPIRLFIEPICEPG